MQITPRRQVNLKFLLVLIIAVAAAGTAVHFVHGYQVERQAGALKEQAERAIADKDPATAIPLLQRYLGFRPGDTDTLEEYGTLLADEGEKAGDVRMLRLAVAAFEEVLRQDPERKAVRRRQVDVALEAGDSITAKDHANILLKQEPLLSDPTKDPERAELNVRIGQAEERAKHYKEADIAYEKASEYAPEQIDLYRHRADLWRLHLDNPGKSDDVMRKMIEQIEKYVPADRKKQVLFQAYLARARYYVFLFPGEVGDRRKKLEEWAKEDVATVRGLASGGTPEQTLERDLVQADLFLGQQNVEEAKNILRSLEQAKGPKDVRLLQTLARLEAADGNADKALALIREALEIKKDRTDLLEDLAEVLIQKGGDKNLAKVNEVIEKLRKSKGEDARAVDYLEARLHILKAEWGQAVSILERVGPLVGTRPRLQSRVYLLLGLCYEQLLSPDQALRAYEQAVKLDPISLPARRGVASMNVAVGRPDRGLEEYRELLRFKTHPADTAVAVARLLIQRNLRLPPDEKRSWEKVTSQLGDAAQELKALAEQNPKSPDVPRLQTEVSLLQIQVFLLEKSDGARDLASKFGPEAFTKAMADAMADARTRLKNEALKHPGQVEFWVALASLQGAEKNGVQPALKTLQEAEESLPPEKVERLAQARRLELRLARLPYLARLPEADARRELGKEEKVAQQWTGEGRSRLLTGLAEAYERLGATADAKRLWRQAADDQPNALAPRLALLDHAITAGDDAEVKAVLEEVRHIEGDQGALWRYAEAGRLLTQAVAEAKAGHGDAEKARLSEARRYLKEAGDKRPGWYRVAALRGEIAQRENDDNQAVEAFQEAVKLGDRRPQVLQRLVQLQLKLKRFEDAQKILEDLRGQDQILLPAGLGKLASLASLSGGHPREALAMALKAVPKDSKDPADHILLGQLYSAVGPDMKGEAEKEFRQACAVAKDDPDPWVWLVSFYMTSGEEAKAKAAVEEAKTKVPPGEWRSALALGSCYATIGQGKEAEEHYQEALKLKPDEPRVLRSVAAYYAMASLPQKAETQLRKLIPITSGEERRWARRTLAAGLASFVDQQHFAEAMDLIEQNLKEDPKSTADRRTRAMLLATRGFQRKKAIRELEDLGREHPLSAEEQFTLYQLYDADGDWPKAQQTMVILLDSPEGRKNAVCRAHYARRLLQRGQLEAAKGQLEALKELAAKPNGAKVNPLLVKEIEARVRRAEGKHQDALTLLTTYAAGAKDADMATVAMLCDEFSRDGDQSARERYRDAAEGLYKNLVTRTKDPGRWLVLAGFYSGHGRTEDALRCCEDAFKEKAPVATVGSTMVATLRAAGPGHDRLVDRVDKWFEQTRKGENADALLLPLADLRDLQKRYGEAENLYREALSKNSNNLVAINNLAWLLALKKSKPDPDEALALVNRGINLAGPSPELLDTRGVIYLIQRNGQGAATDLQDCVDQSPSATRYFHLAQAKALLASGNPQAGVQAAEAWRKAKEGGLRPEQLHPLEYSAYDALKEAMEDKKKATDKG
jgi:tetratricopeptide (TPR) repeat protein